jgi:hypothetical protein
MSWEGHEMSMGRAVAVLVMVTSWYGTALAQEARVGLTMGYPTAVGVLWQVSDRVAVRPEFSWAHSSIENDNAFAQNSADSTGVGFAVSALVRLRQWGAVRSYIAPRFEAVRSTTETTVELPSPQFPPGFPSSRTVETTSTSYEGGGSIGVQASPAPHFGVFGEVGLMYGRTRTEGNSSLLGDALSTTRGNSASIRSAVGVILFF